MKVFFAKQKAVLSWSFLKVSKTGQSTVEFAMVIFLFLFMLALTFSAVVGFATHQYLSYATFMAARAYQAGRDSPQTQRNAAIATMSRYVPGINNAPFNGQLDFRFGQGGGGIVLARITGFDVPDNAAENLGPGGNPQNAYGVMLRFQIPFMRLPLGATLRGTVGTLNMRTVSYLGREVTVEECKSFFVDFFNIVPKKGGGGSHDFAAMEDTGC